MKGVNIFLADGFEDCEALAVNDVLRRGGVDVKLVSINGSESVRSSHGVTVKADAVFDGGDGCSVHSSDFMIFPGGMPGSENLASCGPLIDEMNRHFNSGGSLAAICAAPGLVLSRLESVKGLEFTCFEGFEKMLEAKGASFNPLPSVVCGRIITGRSAGHAVTFGLNILRQLKGDAEFERVSHALYLQ